MDQKNASPQAYPTNVAMAPLRINFIEHFDSDGTEARTIFVLGTCLVLCIFLIVKRLRNRSTMPRIEQLTPFPTADKKYVGRDIFDAHDPISALDRQLLTELLNPLLGEGPRKSSLITSGYLAATAKMASENKTTPLEPVEEFVESPVELRAPDLVNQQNAQQSLQWSRRSSPGPQAAPFRQLDATATIDDEVRDNLFRFSTLHVAAKIDETRHFCDDHNTRIKWRRRTMIFEKSP